MIKKIRIFFLLSASMFVVGCVPPNDVITGGGRQLEIRQYQSRDYEGANKNQTMRAAIGAMQDLEFVIEKADLDLGTVSGTKVKDYVIIKMTVTVRSKGKDSVTVRANATYGDRAVEDPENYRDFFTVLDKALFLTKNKVD